MGVGVWKDDKMKSRKVNGVDAEWRRMGNDMMWRMMDAVR